MNDADYRRLRWRCRRGMLELDVLLNRFLERHYAGLTETERAGFERLLATADAVLIEWCAGTAKPDDPELKRVLDKILQVNDI